MPDDTSGFVINGRTYPIPTLDTFDMDEAQVLYDYAGIALEDFGPAHPEASAEEKEMHEKTILQMAKNPAFKRALLHVAYARGNRDMSQSAIRELVGKVNMLEATLALLGVDDESPPETTDSQNELENGSSTNPTSRLGASGSPSTNDSDVLVAIPARIGTTESATSSRAFVPTE